MTHDLSSKRHVVQAFQARAKQALLTAERAQAIAHDEATSEESKSEGKYDTRATEASYLARGQAERVVKLRALVRWFEQLDAGTPHTRIGMGSLVTLVDESGQRQTLLVCPMGGEKVEFEHDSIRTISLAAPLGRAMAALEEGDDVEWKTAGKASVLEVLSIQ